MKKNKKVSIFNFYSFYSLMGMIGLHLNFLRNSPVIV